MKAPASLILLSLLTLAGCQQSTQSDWKATLDQRLPEYGHRNWIVIADSAYPKQSSPGIETIYTGAEQIEVLRYVLERIDQASHVQALAMRDAELDSVHETASPGVNAYRSELEKLLGEQNVAAMPHEDIIAKLDDASKLFNILLLKTDLTIPYTSVFLELDCGYWDSEREAELRAQFAP